MHQYKNKLIFNYYYLLQKSLLAATMWLLAKSIDFCCDPQQSILKCPHVPVLSLRKKGKNWNAFSE